MAVGVNALVIGGAACVWRDMEVARRLGMFHCVIAVNSAIAAYKGEIDHAVSFHSEVLPHWLEVRRREGRSDVGAMWTVEGHYAPPGLPINFVAQWGGSSGLIAAQVGMQVAHRVVLCGVPLDPESEHFDRLGAWRDAIGYRSAWSAHVDSLRGKVRSMSGWSAELLGLPTAEWLSTSALDTTPIVTKMETDEAATVIRIDGIR